MDGVDGVPGHLPNSVSLRSRVPREELRFAVVLNGGVSLAVWMGGATHELNRLTFGKDLYEHVLWAACSTARADVLAGTSAGGINGAALALAQVNEEADLGMLRDLWSDQGRMESLLRRPFDGSPTSLLSGDEYFLPQLRRALERLASPYSASGRPVTLTITTTLLNGAPMVTADDLGERLYQTIHAGRFTFRREERPDTEAGNTSYGLREVQDLVPEIALAARSSAGFPVAFEPSFVPARDRPADGACSRAAPTATPSPTRAGPDRPDLGAVASWRCTGVPGQIPDDRSRFVVDGGVLANTPTRDALLAIEDMSAEGPVRRVMMLVYPHAGTDADGPDTADSLVDAPTVTGTLAALLRALTAEGSRTFVEEVERHNELAAGWRGGRTDVLWESREIKKLYRLVTTAWPFYQERRIRASARTLARTVASVDGWSLRRIQDAAEAAQRKWFNASDGKLPYVPARPPPCSECLPTVVEIPVTATDDKTATPLAWCGWQWGTTTAVGIADSAIDLLRRLVWIVDDEANIDAVREARRRVHAARKDLAEARDQIDNVWRTAPLADLEPDADYWLGRLARYDRAMMHGGTQENDIALQAKEALIERATMRGHDAAEVRTALSQPTSGEIGDRIATNVRTIVEALMDLRPLAEELLHDPTKAARVRLGELEAWRMVVAPLREPTVAQADQDQAVAGSTASISHYEVELQILLLRMLALEVATWLVADEVTTGGSRPVELVQLSLQVRNPFTVDTRTADDKVGGMSINRFGGFLKRSWRVNDWMWGRLDGATRLCQVVLDPERLRRAAVLTGDLSSQDGCERCRPSTGGSAPEPCADGKQPQPSLCSSCQTTIVRSPSAPPLPEAIQVNYCAHCRASAFVNELVTRLYKADIDDPALGDPLRKQLRNLRTRAVQEVCTVHRDDASDADVNRRPTFAGEYPASFPALAQLAAYALHLRIITEELPALAAAIRADRVDGAHRRSRGMVFLEEHCDLLRRLQVAVSDPREQLKLGFEALCAFDRAGIGREPLAEEGTSDQMIRTATTAAAVAATVVDSSRSGLAWLKPATRILRGAMLLPYWTVNGLTRGGAIARQLALFGLSLGAVLLTLSLFAVLPPWASAPATTLGASALLVAFGYAALRTGTVLHGLVLLAPVIPLVVFAVEKAADQPPDSREGVSATQASAAVLLIVGLALGLTVLGSLPAQLGSPLATVLVWLDKMADRYEARQSPPRPTMTLNQRRRSMAGRLALRALAVVVLLAVAGLFVWLSRDPLSQAVAWIWGRRLAIAIAATVVGPVIGVWGAYNAGGQFRLWRQRPDRTWQRQPVVHPAGSTAGWSVVYGSITTAAAWTLATALADVLRQPWGVAALVTAILMSAILLLVVPFALLAQAHRKLVRQLLNDPAMTALARRTTFPAEFPGELNRRGLAYAYLVTTMPGQPDARLVLTKRAGEALQRRLITQAGDAVARPT